MPSPRRPVVALLRLAPAALAILLVAAGPPAPIASGPPAFTLMEAPATGGSAQPNLAVDPSGRVWLSWLEALPRGGNALRAARFEGVSWGTPIDVVAGDSVMGISVDVPQFLPMGGVHLAALYLSKLGGEGHGREVRLIQSLNGGASWLAPVVANRDATPTEHGFASLVPDSAGARAIWLDGRKSATKNAAGRMTVMEEGMADMVLRTAVLTDENTLTGEAEIDSRVCDCCPTSAAGTMAGAIVAYRDRSPAEIRDIAVARFDRDGWSAPTAVHADGWKIQGCPVNGPSISAAREDVAVAWYTAARDTARVLAAFSSDGGRHFGRPVRVDAGAPMGRASCALIGDGSAIVAWIESGKETRLLARRVTRDGAAGPITTVTTLPGGRGAGIPHLVRSGGVVVLAWTESGAVSRIRTAVARADFASH
jgi:hypothetical protein